ncbi:hypothetical protein DKX38_001608 [Salix brachista]|uniref:Protein kinase domain-containing protein n=1 Tax=Salix brachista TaxID=2182728 RepID=A0A5N5P462_9ROSI|nr:hypothetical protein DKX38_001608 [Salix brachista]
MRGDWLLISSPLLPCSASMKDAMRFAAHLLLSDVKNMVIKLNLTCQDPSTSVFSSCDYTDENVAREIINHRQRLKICDFGYSKFFDCYQFNLCSRPCCIQDPNLQLVLLLLRRFSLEENMMAR